MVSGVTRASPGNAAPAVASMLCGSAANGTESIPCVARLAPFESAQGASRGRSGRRNAWHSNHVAAMDLKQLGYFVHVAEFADDTAPRSIPRAFSQGDAERR